MPLPERPRGVSDGYQQASPLRTLVALVVGPELILQPLVPCFDVVRCHRADELARFLVDEFRISLLQPSSVFLFGERVDVAHMGRWHPWRERLLLPCPLHVRVDCA